jgi:hypothetical protein
VNDVVSVDSAAVRQPGADQHAGVAGEAADQRRDPDHHSAGDQHPATAEQVGGAAAEQHESPVGEQVGARHPLQALHREVQVAADGWERHVDDRRVNEVHEGDAAQQQQGQLAASGGEKAFSHNGKL